MSHKHEYPIPIISCLIFCLLLSCSVSRFFISEKSPDFSDSSLLTSITNTYENPTVSLDFQLDSISYKDRKPFLNFEIRTTSKKRIKKGAFVKNTFFEASYSIASIKDNYNNDYLNLSSGSGNKYCSGKTQIDYFFAEISYPNLASYANAIYVDSEIELPTIPAINTLIVDIPNPNIESSCFLGAEIEFPITKVQINDINIIPIKHNSETKDLYYIIVSIQDWEKNQIIKLDNVFLDSERHKVADFNSRDYFNLDKTHRRRLRGGFFTATNKSSIDSIKQVELKFKGNYKLCVSDTLELDQ